MKDSGTFVRSLLPVDANNIVTLVDFNQILTPYKEFEIDWILSHAIILEDFQVKCGLFSLLEADWPQTNAVASESAIEAEQARIKKEGQKIYLKIFHAYGNGPWIEKAEEILQNKNSLEMPWALMAPAFSTNETALIDEDLKIGVQIASKAQGIGGLKGNDYLRLFGSWRKVTNWRKKKDDGVEALQSRISALETLLSVYGAPSANLPGSNGLVPAPPAGSGEFLLRGDRGWENPSKFATPQQITAAINSLVGSSSTALDTLAELGAALANDANFAASMTGQLNSKLTAAANLSDLSSRQTALNNLSGGVTANRVLRTNGTNVLLSLLDLTTDVTGNLSAANGGVTSVAQTFTGEKTFSGITRITNTAASTSTTTGAHIVAGGQAVGGNQYIGGFTALGDNVAIKIKRLTGGITGATEGSNTFQAHGLTGSKIIGVIATIEYDTGSWMSSGHTFYPGYEFSAYVAGINIDICLHATNSENIRSKPFAVVIIYMA